NSVLLKPLPYPEPQGLVRILSVRSSGDTVNMDYVDYSDLSTAQRSLEYLSIQYLDDFDVSGDTNAERVPGAYETATHFKVDGLPFILGRPFIDEEDKPGGPMVVVLTEPF